MMKLLNPFENFWESQKIYDSIVLIKNIKKILEEWGIQWWLSMGSLLGQYHFGHMLPWDDDIDIQILLENQKQYDFLEEKIKIKIENFSFETPKNKKNLSLFEKAIMFRKNNNKNPLVDITSSYYSKGKIKGCGNNNYYRNIFPTKTKKFLNIDVQVPFKEKSFLIEKYGKKCMTTATACRYSHQSYTVIFEQYKNYNFKYSDKCVLKGLKDFELQFKNAELMMQNIYKKQKNTTF